MLTKDQRQAVMDEYMAETLANIIVPREFIEWLRPQEDHPAHPYFFAKSDGDAAMEYRLALFRQFAAGLRIKVKVEYSEPVTQTVSVVVREFPAYISPASSRKAGGGYVPMVPEYGPALDELLRQGAQSLQSWLRRYAGAFEKAGVDLTPITKIAGQIEARVDAA